MSYISTDKENGFMGPGVYHQCSNVEDIRALFKDFNLTDVIFTAGASLTEEEGDSFPIGFAVTNSEREGYVLFEEPMKGEDIAGAICVMLALGQNPNVLNGLYPPTSAERYIDHFQNEPVVQSFEIFHSYNGGEHFIISQNILKPKHDFIVNK